MLVADPERINSFYLVGIRGNIIGGGCFITLTMMLLATLLYAWRRSLPLWATWLIMALIVHGIVLWAMSSEGWPYTKRILLKEGMLYMILLHLVLTVPLWKWGKKLPHW